MPVFVNNFMARQYDNPANMTETSYKRANLNYLLSAGGFSDAPRTYYLSYIHPFMENGGSSLPSYQQSSANYNNTKSAVGGYMLYDSYGFINQFSGMVSYAQKFKLNLNSYLSFGLSTGVYSSKFDYSKLTIQQLQDQTYQNYLNNNKALIFWDANFGFLYSNRSYKVEGAIKQFLSNKAQLSESGVQSIVNPTYYLRASSLYTLSSDIDFAPSVLFYKVKTLPYQLLLNTDFVYQGKYLAGLIYNHNRSSGFRVGIIYDNLILNYAFNYNTSKYAVIGYTNHEIGLMYVLDRNRRVKMGDFL
jgi:type IX secretion system PorP/SprF family membrane protein